MPLPLRRRNSLKNRLDIVLVEKGLFPSREKAKAAVMAGMVWVDGARCDKAGTPVNPTSAVLEIRGNLCPYVSRGGMKLEKALHAFQIDLTNAVCMDIGASTGGFTDCMLQHGAAKVYAADVGYGQLDWKLRNDPRVVTMERVNVRYLDPETIPERFDLVTIDVSFISLKLILPVAGKLLKEHGRCLCLVKPQFEAGRSQVGKNGIVRDRRIHLSVLRAVLDYGKENNLTFAGLTFSPITGTKGNIEFLLLLESGIDNRKASEEIIEDIVDQAHRELDR